MESPPHRENLLRGRFREIGIAPVRGTPQAVSAADGITVTTEYGYRAARKGKKDRAGSAGKRFAVRG